ncbi:UPF0111 protein [Proteiniborus sp. DW1]|uniref:DUF47 domain-containing protein n=1 Tax=Proteiniborus sp. DW1 TaxID=1889883 RepID=UPI00092E060D|nr:DUF47 family protein [Proteiniborus sp. DW1]SCG83041.1 UPF0111 protein [Proteiniborus sp. DW1]
MARKKDVNYFDTFVELAEYSCQAANLLNEIVNNFKADELQQRMKEMHTIEHSGDEARHVMIKRLAKEFITPIEREDIMAMADSIDEVTDTIEDVLMCMYMYNVSYVREDALRMTEIVVKCCDALKQMLSEFHNFRKSQTLHNLVVEINNFEEEADKLFMEAIRNLYVTCKDVLEITAWDKIYNYLEKCCDVCENVSSVVESVIMKNS